MKAAVLSVCSKNALNLNYKIITSPENGQPHPFHPTQLPLPNRITALTTQSKCQSFQRWQIKQTTFWGNRSPWYTTHLCQPILKQSPKDTPLNFTSLGIRLTFILHISLSWTLPKQLSMLHHAFVPIHPEPTSQRYITKPQTLRFSSHTSLFWTLPEQLSMLHHACEPTHPEPRSQDTLQTSDPKIFIPHIPVLNFAEADYTSHVCQPWTNVAKIHHKTSDPKILSDTSLFWTLPGQLSILHHACVPTHPEPTSQRYITKPQTVRFSSHTPVWNFAGAALHVTPRMCHPEPTSQDTLQTSDLKIFISHIPVLNFAGTTRNRLRMCANPEPPFQRYTTKPQTLRFSSHTSLFWTLSQQLSILHHTCEPTLPEPTSQDTLQTSDRKIFISHIPVLNFAGTDYTSHVCQPWTSVAKIHHKTSDP